MNRLLAVAVLGILGAGTARADIGPPPGLKRVPQEYKLIAGESFPDHLFFVVHLGNRVEPVKLDPKTPTTVKLANARFATLVAVPRDAAKKYPGEKEFLEAVAQGKVEGLVRAKVGFSGLATIKEADTRKVVVVQYRVEKVLKDDIVLTSPKGEAPGSPSGSPPPKLPLAAAGISLAAALMFGGLWLARRNRGTPVK